jgi:DNA-binding transcriptional ArsR family regulator
MGLLRNTAIDFIWLIPDEVAPKNVEVLGDNEALFRCEARVDMVKMAKQSAQNQSMVVSDAQIEKAADVFRVMSAPMRLRIISCLCQGEKNVGELLAAIETTQPNMSQHLNTLYLAGILDKRREGVQIYYRIVNNNIVNICRAVCHQTDIQN